MIPLGTSRCPVCGVPTKVVKAKGLSIYSDGTKIRMCTCYGEAKVSICTEQGDPIGSVRSLAIEERHAIIGARMFPLEEVLRNYEVKPNQIEVWIELTLGVPRYHLKTHFDNHEIADKVDAIMDQIEADLEEY